ncbi:MAG: response regulator, partial [Fluviicola sp.]|nr:response regulator [Fluviicola sp.]
MVSILIIDDEDDIRDILKYNLEKEGFYISVASNGEQGLKLIQQSIPDLIILDVMMPGMDGIEVCEAIRNNAECNKILICLLTARNEDYSQIAGLNAGADDYVAKPIKPKVLVSRINALLRRKGKIELSNNTKSSDLVINR